MVQHIDALCHHYAWGAQGRNDSALRIINNIPKRAMPWWVCWVQCTTALWISDAREKMAQHDQLMMQQLEQLQRLVKEQQKLITLINPGLTFPAGPISPLITMMPNVVPPVPSTEGISKNNFSQLPNQRTTQTDPIADQMPGQKTSNELNTKYNDVQNNPSQDVAKSTVTTQMAECPKTLSPVKEDKDEDNNGQPLSPFGVRTRPVNREERPIRPGIGDGQKTFEDFVEEHLKVDSDILEKEQPHNIQTACESKTTSRKSFLKRGEGIIRFENKCDNQSKEQRRHSITTLSRRVSFDSPHRNSLPMISDTGKMQPKNSLMVHKPTSSSSDMNLNDITSSSRFNKTGATTVDCYPHMPEKKGLGIDEGQQSVKEFSNLKSKDAQDIAAIQQIQIEDQQSNAVLKNTCTSELHMTSSIVSVKKEIRTDPEANLLQKAMKNVTDLKTESEDIVDAASKAGFKKINDKIVKVNTESSMQNKSHSHTHAKSFRQGIFHKEHVEPLSETDSSTSSYSDDDPKSKCFKLPTCDSQKNLSQTDRHLDLSDPDYASDEPSGEEEIRPSAKTLSVQQDHSFSTSGSERSTEDFRRRGKKAFSSIRSISSRPSQTLKKEKEPDKKTDCKDGMDKVELQNPPPSTYDIVASLFPTLKINSDITENLEKLEESKQTVYDSPLLSKMKEEQDKAMLFLRQQMDHLERFKADELNRLEEFKKEEMKKLQKQKELEKQAAATKAIKDGERNGEIQILKQQILELQEHFRRNEFHWSSTHENLKSQVETLTRENQVLRSELRASEINFTDGPSNQSESMVSQAILQGTSDTKYDVQYQHTVHKSRSGTPVGRKTPVPSESLARVTSFMEKAEFEKPSLRNGDRAPSGSLHNRSYGRKTPLQGRIAQFEPEKVVSLPVLGIHRKSPVTVSHFTVFKEPNISSHSRGRQSYSGSSDDTQAPALKNDDFINSLQDTNANQDAEALSVRNFQEHPLPWVQAQLSTNKTRTRSVTPSGRKTPTEYTQSSDIKGSIPKSILSRKSSMRVDNKSNEEDNIQEETQYPDGKVERLLSDGRRVITFSNGTKKEISADGLATTVSFFNGDVKKIMPDQSIVYYYADAQTTHTTYPNGMEVLQFPNKQIEKHHPEGTKEIVFPDRTVKLLFKDGHEETTFPDGTVVKLEKTGHKTVIFHNGQKEIHTAQFKRREYPDGTIKTVYSNGRQETKYSSGRVRIKDQQGNIILDKK
ncbi:uncharacterized protein RCH25_043688 [Pelodytes ibericus]